MNATGTALHSLANQIDSEASTASRSGQLFSLERIAKKLRLVAEMVSLEDEDHEIERQQQEAAGHTTEQLARSVLLDAEGLIDSPYPVSFYDLADAVGLTLR